MYTRLWNLSQNKHPTLEIIPPVFALEGPWYLQHLFSLLILSGKHTQDSNKGKANKLKPCPCTIGAFQGMDVTKWCTAAPTAYATLLLSCWKPSLCPKWAHLIGVNHCGTLLRAPGQQLPPRKRALCNVIGCSRRQHTLKSRQCLNGRDRQLS